MTSFSEKITLPYLLQQGIQKRLWQGKIIDVKLIAHHSAIIIGSAGAELFDFTSQKTIWEIDCPIQNAVISFDNKFFVTSWQDKYYIWDLERGKFLHQLSPSSLKRYITSKITFLTNSTTIAFVESYTSLIFYDLSLREYTQKITESRDIEYITFSCDRKIVAFLFEDNTVTIYELESKILLQKSNFHQKGSFDPYFCVLKF